MPCCSKSYKEADKIDPGVDFCIFQGAAFQKMKDEALTCPNLQGYTHLPLESAVEWWLVCH